MNPAQVSEQQFIEWLSALPDEHTFITNDSQQCIIAQFLNATCTSVYDVELRRREHETIFFDFIAYDNHTGEKYCLADWIQNIVQFFDNLEFNASVSKQQFLKAAQSKGLIKL